VVDYLRAKPREMMRRIPSAVNGDLQVAVFIQPSGKVPGFSRAYTLEPSKFSGFAIVMQQLAQARAGHPATFSHGDLAK